MKYSNLGTAFYIGTAFYEKWKQLTVSKFRNFREKNFEIVKKNFSELFLKKNGKKYSNPERKNTKKNVCSGKKIQ